MSHQRQEIRDKVVELLTGIAEVNERVFPNRARRLFEEELPAILVYTKSETGEIGVQAPREYKRTLKLAIEIVAKADEDLDNDLDDIAKEIETRLFRNETLDGLVSDVQYSDTEIEFEPEAQVPVGAARLTFDVEYWTEAPDEIPDLDDFEKAHIETLPEGATDDTEPAVDDLDMTEED